MGINDTFGMVKSSYIDIDGRWGIIVNYGYGLQDYDDLWAIMRSFGMTDKNANRALKVLSNYNTGMCVSNGDIRMSAIFISKASTASEWWSTVIHEIKHAADAIIDYYGVDWDGEDAAYLTGHIVKQLVEKVGEPCYD